MKQQALFVLSSIDFEKILHITRRLKKFDSNLNRYYLEIELNELKITFYQGDVI